MLAILLLSPGSTTGIICEIESNASFSAVGRIVSAIEKLSLEFTKAFKALLRFIPFELGSAMNWPSVKAKEANPEVAIDDSIFCKTIGDTVKTTPLDIPKLFESTISLADSFVWTITLLSEEVKDNSGEELFEEVRFNPRDKLIELTLLKLTSEVLLANPIGVLVIKEAPHLYKYLILSSIPTELVRIVVVPGTKLMSNEFPR